MTSCEVVHIFVYSAQSHDRALAAQIERGAEGEGEGRGDVYTKQNAGLVFVCTLGLATLVPTLAALALGKCCTSLMLGWYFMTAFQPVHFSTWFSHFCLLILCWFIISFSTFFFFVFFFCRPGALRAVCAKVRAGKPQSSFFSPFIMSEGASCRVPSPPELNPFHWHFSLT